MDLMNEYMAEIDVHREREEKDAAIFCISW